MKHLRTIITALCALILTQAAGAREFGPLTLHYNAPATSFQEAMVIGNGSIGASVYGGYAINRFSLNDITLWTGEPEKEQTGINAWKHLPELREALFNEDYKTADQLSRKIQGHYSQRYQPLGNLYIEYKGHEEVSAYKRWLDISDATVHDSYMLEGGLFTTDCFVSAPDSVMVICLKSEAPIEAVVRMDSQQPHTVSSNGKEVTVDGYTAYLSYPTNHVPAGEPDIKYDPERGIHFRTIAHVEAADGTVSANPDGSLTLSGCHNVTILVTDVTSFNGFDKDPVKEGRDYKADVRARIDAAAAKTAQQMLASHVADYKSYFDRVSLNLGTTPDEIVSLPTDEQLARYGVDADFNPELETLYFQFGRYLLISCSRTRGIPANLQGLWNESVAPPWNSNYTVNINLEENYWPAGPAALADLEDLALFSFLENVSKNGKASSRDFYGIERGWSLAHNSDVWAMSNPVGAGTGDPRWANWNMGGAWLSTHIWENYLFTNDKEQLKKNWEVLKGAAEFCLDWLVEKDGELITAPSSSPENAYVTDTGYSGATLYGGTADLAIIRECLTDAALASKVLGRDCRFRREVRRTLKKLHPYKIGSQGQLLEWFHDWKDKDPQHRHQSHMIGLYPGHQITPESTPELAAASVRSLEIKGDRSTGWSTGWRINLWARLKNAQKAYLIYRNLLTYVTSSGTNMSNGGGTYANLLDAHPPFQIDGNFGGCAGVMEMLVQSSPECIELLPAVPQQWKSGSVKGIRARGGLSIDMEWADGKVTSLSVTNVSPRKTKTAIICNGASTKVKVRSGQTLRVI